MADWSPKPGETGVAYIKRMHGPKGCNCPRAYSRCAHAVAYDKHYDNRANGHGGWGWGS